MAAIRSNWAGNSDEILSAAYSVSLFTDWKSESFHQVWLKSRVDQSAKREFAQSWFGATSADENLHPLPEHDAESCTDQMGRPGPWHQRLPHFKLEFTPSSGAELQSEYFVARSDIVPALNALLPIRSDLSSRVFVTEIRSIAQDDLWLSPAYQRDSAGIHFTWKPDGPKVRALLPEIERLLEPFSPRPHWGKLYAMSPNGVVSRYPRFDDFKSIACELDPNGKLLNDFLRPYLR